MFALWYLSLAVDEMRKHFGWTFFDIFYKNSQAATPNKALDNKPSIYLPKPSETSVPSAPKSVEKLTPTRPEVSKSLTPPKPTPSSATVARTVPVTPLPVVPKPASEMPVPEALVNPTPVEVKPTIPASQLKTADQNVPSTSTQTGTNGSFNDSMDWKLMKTSKLKEYDENLMENLRNASSDFLSGESVNPVSSMPAIPKPACKMPGPKGFLNPTPVENEPTTPPVTTFPVVSKPEFQPETFDNPTSVEFKPIIPVNPLKTVDQNIHSASSQSGTNGSLNDLMDRKLMETSKLKENGENLRQNLKSATSDFLSGEAMVQSPPKISKLMAARICMPECEKVFHKSLLQLINLDLGKKF